MGVSTRFRFIVTILLGSFLLFLVQPMVARLALPRLGGAPAVWNSAMLVYQALLLAGYSYAHWLGRLAPQRQAMVHLAAFLVAGLTLPIGLIAAMPSADANPFLWVPWLLLVSIGPLFLVVSAQAPLLQRWFALSGGGDPYPLYAASNFGSFAGLLSYPLLVEPNMALGHQRLMWSGGYCLLALLVAWCWLAVPRQSTDREGIKRSEPPSVPELLRWVIVAAVPSGLILSTTLHLTTDIGAMPLLWVVPLGLYLLSFTIAFAANRGPARTIARIAPFVLIAAAAGLFVEVKPYDLIFGGIALANLFSLSVALHGELFDRRPHPSQLTLFYLMLSVGGVVGGIFAALLAPLIFDWTYEHLILLAAAAYLIRCSSPFGRHVTLWNDDRLARRITAVGIALVGILAFSGKGVFGLPHSNLVSAYALFAIVAVAIVGIGNRPLFAAAIVAVMITVGAWEKIQASAEPGRLTRSFFGIYSILPEGDDARTLVHGTTVHGVQNLGSPARERMATSYYAPESGVGIALSHLPQLFGANARVGVVGLGAGTVACYARPGQRWTFYEIDPAVVRIAKNPKRFTFLDRCLPGVPIKIGDARLSLAQLSSGSLDVLVVDAFSSDAIPMHLLTAEAFDLYRRIIGQRGLLLVHISNRYFRLEPVVAAAAQKVRWKAAQRIFKPSALQHALNQTSSKWIAMTEDEATLRRLLAAEAVEWHFIAPTPGLAAWTDDNASVLPLIRWR